MLCLLQKHLHRTTLVSIVVISLVYPIDGAPFVEQVQVGITVVVVLCGTGVLAPHPYARDVTLQVAIAQGHFLSTHAIFDL